MKGESDEDLYKVIPSLSLTRSMYLLTMYFKEYKDKLEEESSCPKQHTGTANGKCSCHKYSSKLDEILTSLCKALEDDTSDDILSNAIQFVSYVVKDEFSVVKEFNYEDAKKKIEKEEFNKDNKLGCCCCCTSKDKGKCCCIKVDGGTCSCNTATGGQCRTDDKCCCKDNTDGQCCCIKGITPQEEQDNITLCDCCCKHVNGKCEGQCNCKPVAEKECYCCCLCEGESATCECQDASTDSTSTSTSTRCCCKECGTTGCCEKCQCNKEIKICNCCKCIETDKIISCCELDTKSEVCGKDNCCCSKDCKKCEEFSNDCNGLNSTSNCENNLGEYCGDTAKCNLDICKITCCMSNLTTKTGSNNVCLSDIIKDMKSFYGYLGRIGSCNGSTCTCKCPENSECCCEKENGKCCDLYCRVKNMFKEIFTPSASGESGNGHNGRESICKDSNDKCIFCILCCLKKNATKIQSEYNGCKESSCCNITKCEATTTNGCTENGCTTSGGTECTNQCPATTSSCTPSTETTGECQCKEICDGCPDPKCCDCEGDSSCSTCKFSPSSISTCIKKLYRYNVRIF